MSLAHPVVVRLKRRPSPQASARLAKVVGNGAMSWEARSLASPCSPASQEMGGAKLRKSEAVGAWCLLA